jgi:hypothetical protein
MTINTTLYVDQGTDFTVDINVPDVTITNQSFVGKSKKMYAVDTSFDLVISVNGDSPNSFTLTIPSATTNALTPGKYRYDVVMDDGMLKTKIAEGLLILRDTISL